MPVEEPSTWAAPLIAALKHSSKEVHLVEDHLADVTGSPALGHLLQVLAKGRLLQVDSDPRSSLFSAEVATIATKRDTRDRIVPSSWRSKPRTMANSRRATREPGKLPMKSGAAIRRLALRTRKRKPRMSERSHLQEPLNTLLITLKTKTTISPSLSFQPLLRTEA